MNNKFDELTKSMARSVTRRGALKKFGVGLAGMALACFGLADKARAGKTPGGGGKKYCWVSPLSQSDTSGFLTGYCGDCSAPRVSPDCPYGAPATWTKVCFHGENLPTYLSSIPCHP